MLKSFSRRHGYVDPGAMLQQAAILCCVRRGSRTHLEEILALFDAGEIVSFEYRPLSFPPSYALWKKGDHFYLAIAGTANVWQYLGHFTGAVISVGHNGHSFNTFFAGIAHNSFRPILNPFIETGELKKLSLTGHSYGGGVATVLAAEYAAGAVTNLNSEVLRPDFIEYMSFGAPRSLGLGWSLEPQPNAGFHVYHEEDPVPKLPPKLLQMLTNRFTGGPIFSLSFNDKWAHLADRVCFDDNGDYVDRFPEPNGFFASLPDIDEPIDFDKHPIDNYARLAIRQWVNHHGGVTMDRLIAPLQAVLALPDNQSDNVNINPSTYVDFTAANTVYYGNGADVLDSNSVVQTESVSMSLGEAEFGGASNIGPPSSITASFAGGDPVATSGLWNVSLFLNNSLYGRSETYTLALTGGSSIDEAFEKAKLLADERRKILGNEWATAQANRKTLGAPQIEYIRIVDVRSPRYGQLFDVKRKKYLGLINTGGNPADVLSTTMSMRLRGKNVDDTDIIHQSNLITCGQPDDCVKSGELNEDYVMRTNGQTFGELLVAYVNYLTTEANKIGFMGLPKDDATPGPGKQPKQDIEGFELNEQNKWVAEVTAHGYSSGDHVNITGVSPSVFNVRTRIVKVDADHFILRKGPNADVSPGEFGKVQRYKDKNGVELGSFYQYLPPVAALSFETLGVKVRTVGLRREFVPMTFHRRASQAT